MPLKLARLLSHGQHPRVEFVVPAFNRAGCPKENTRVGPRCDQRDYRKPVVRGVPQP